MESFLVHLTLSFILLVTEPLTTPEQAHAFLVTMRDKQKAADVIGGKPPTNLSADGMDAWYLAVRQREREMKARRQEAEALLRGYRMTMSHDKNIVSREKGKDGLSPVVGKLFDDGMSTINESMEDEFDFEGAKREIGRLSIDESIFSDHYDSQNRDVGRLLIDDNGRLSGQFMPSSRDTGRLSIDPPEARGPEQRRDSSGYVLETPRNEEEKKTDGEDTMTEKRPPQSSKKGKRVPTPARAMLPDETEWRDFVSSGKIDCMPGCITIEKEKCLPVSFRVIALMMQSRERRFHPRLEDTTCMPRMLALDPTELSLFVH